MFTEKEKYNAFILNCKRTLKPPKITYNKDSFFLIFVARRATLTLRIYTFHYDKEL
jgi:hypothetical protein